MHTLQVAIFILGLLSFLAATIFVGQVTGEILWQVGVAAMLINLASHKLWPPGKTD